MWINWQQWSIFVLVWLYLKFLKGYVWIDYLCIPQRETEIATGIVPDTDAEKWQPRPVVHERPAISHLSPLEVQIDWIPVTCPFQPLCGQWWCKSHCLLSSTLSSWELGMDISMRMVHQGLGGIKAREQTMFHLCLAIGAPCPQLLGVRYPQTLLSVWLLTFLSLPPPPPPSPSPFPWIPSPPPPILPLPLSPSHPVPLSSALRHPSPPPPRGLWWDG